MFLVAHNYWTHTDHVHVYLSVEVGGHAGQNEHAFSVFSSALGPEIVFHWKGISVDIKVRSSPLK